MGDSQTLTDLKVAVQRLKREAAEHRGDFKRISCLLGAVGVFFSSFGSEQGKRRYLNSLAAAASALDILTPNEVNLTLGLSDLIEEVESLWVMLESSHERIDRFHKEYLNILKKREWWQKALLELEACDGENEAECSKAIKSTSFHLKKKMQYQSENKLALQGLSSVGYEQSLDHASLVHLGKEVQHMENQVKPLSVQLDCYKHLPPNLAQAYIKLQERRKNFNDIDKEFSEKLVDVAVSVSPDL